MEKNNYEAVLHSLEHGTSPTSQEEKVFVTFFKKFADEYTSILPDGAINRFFIDPIPSLTSLQLLQVYWPRLVITDLGRKLKIPNSCSEPENDTFPPIKPTIDDCHVRVFQMMRQLGDQAGDVMGEAYIDAILNKVI